MAITRNPPNTILLGGIEHTIPENAYLAGGVITPGQLVEFYASGTDLLVRRNSSATEICTMAVALEQSEMNLGVDSDYAVGDLVKVAFLQPGNSFWGLIPSGQDIAIGELLQTNGDGNLKTAAATTQAAGVARLQALDAPGSVTALTRVRVQVIQ